MLLIIKTVGCIHIVILFDELWHVYTYTDLGLLAKPHAIVTLWNVIIWGVFCFAIHHVALFYILLSFVFPVFTIGCCSIPKTCTALEAAWCK